MNPRSPSEWRASWGLASSRWHLPLVTLLLFVPPLSPFPTHSCQYTRLHFSFSHLHSQVRAWYFLIWCDWKKSEKKPFWFWQHTPRSMRPWSKVQWLFRISKACNGDQGKMEREGAQEFKGLNTCYFWLAAQATGSPSLLCLFVSPYVK